MGHKYKRYAWGHRGGAPPCYSFLVVSKKRVNKKKLKRKSGKKSRVL